MNPDGRLTLLSLTQEADEAVTLALAALSLGANWNETPSGNLSKMSVTQATVWFLAELLTAERYQLLSWTESRGYANGLPVWRIMNGSQFGATLIWRTFLLTQALRKATFIATGGSISDWDDLVGALG